MRVVFGKVPVLTDANLAVLKLEQVSGRELMNSGKRGNGIGHISVIKIFEQSLGVDYGEFGRDGEDRFDFGSEVKISVVERIVKRLLAQAVAGEGQFAFGLIVDGEGEHATQFLDAVGAHLFVEMNNDFGVGVGVKAMAAAFELGAEFGKVVNLAVENDPCAAVFVEDRLMAAGEVDDTEAAHAETSAVGDVESLVVGAAVHDLAAHVAHESFGNVALASCAHHSSDSTHGLCPAPKGASDFGKLTASLKRYPETSLAPLKRCPDTKAPGARVLSPVCGHGRRWRSRPRAGLPCPSLHT